MIMYTVVTERGQISIPAEIRRRFHLVPRTKVEWLETEEGIFILPVPEDPIRAFRGSGKGKGSTRFLLEERRKERAKGR
jgi:AbrB family looped-hinge helix DNA binding protein